MYVSLTSADKLVLNTARQYKLDDPVEVPAEYNGPVCCYRLTLPTIMAQRDIPKEPASYQIH